jgi:flotillin
VGFGYKIAEPNEALIVSGKRGGGGAEESQQFKIVASGDRVFVWPFIQSARSLPLDLFQATVPVNCVTTQGIPVRIIGVVAFKIGADNDSISNAAQRFMHDPSTMEQRVKEIFAGHIRGIVGSLQVEELIRDREKLTTEARNATGLDMEKMGLAIDTLQIAEIDDPSGYIENLSKPDIARVQMESRIAEAQRDREASEREQENKALIAEAERESEIKQAGFRAEVDKAQAEAAQAGPLAEAESRQAVVERETEIAKLEAQRTEQQLQTTVRRPADAQAYAVAKQAEGARDATIREAEGQAEAAQKLGMAEAEADKAKGLASAEVTKAKGMAEGEALKARADGLAANQDAVIGQTLVEQLPRAIEAAAGAFSNVDNMTVLNGADGVMDAVTSIVTSVGATLSTARKQFSAGAEDQVEIPVGANGGH